MKIIVTGAMGHIGSYLIRHFSTQFPGSEIVMVDNLSTQRFSSLFNLPITVNYRFVEADVTSYDLSSIFENADYVVHLAAITDAAASFGNAEIVENNNFKSTAHVAKACLASGAKLITLSSTSVYGCQDGLVTEDCPLADLKPQSPYAETKYREEELVRRMHREEGLKVVTCRFGTIFGVSPGIRFHTAVNKFCWQAVMGIPLSVWSTAYDQKRPYLDLFDAARAISFIIQKDSFEGNLYNVLTLNATVRDIVDAIGEFVPDLSISFVDNPIMNQLSYEVDSSRFANAGFSCCGDLRSGIGDTVGLLKAANRC